ncbi:DUF3813 domain-containing protein [Bacillus sp. 2205SS5-2]|uniref:DUF3813 domain-containing protein n=1 Tax=Bacillus sp. 2205SS5-2 TaxID=3109031 RepID=UPI00300759C3
MTNPLYVQARDFVEQAVQACEAGDTEVKQAYIDKAKNALSSAYANSNVYEQAQLRQMQTELSQLH